MTFVIGLGTFLRALLVGSATIALKNLALRHQLLVLQRDRGDRQRRLPRDRPACPGATDHSDKLL